MLFRVLGPVEVGSADTTDAVSYIGAHKPRRLLALLLLRANAWVSVAELVDTVWAGQPPPASAERNIGTYVWQLRKTLPPLGEQRQRIESRSGAYRIRVEPGELDTERFEALLTAGTEALAAGDPAAAVERLDAARSLWRGAPYEGFVTDAHLPEVARLTEQHWSARQHLADALIGTGRLTDAIALCTSLTAEDPLRESVWVRLLVAYREAGRKADALAAYQRARAALVEELGAEPGPELRALQQSLLAEPPERTEPAQSSKQPPDGTSDRHVRPALEAAAALGGGDPGARDWFAARQAELTAAVAGCLSAGDVRNAWLLTSALHEYVEHGGQVGGWPEVVARVAAATRAGQDWYGELIARNILGIAHTRAGRLAEARSEFTAALALAAGHDDRDAEDTIRVNLSELGEAAGRNAS